MKQLTEPCKIYVDFECNVKRVRSSDRSDNALYTKKYQKHIPCSFAYKVVCVDDKFSKPVVLYRGKHAINRFIKEYNYYKKVLKKHFNKNLVIPAEVEESFQSSNKCWICDKLYYVGDNKARDHCHITREYRGTAHWSCNANLKLTKNVPVLFHDLRSYDSHLIMQEIDKFNAKINVIPKGLEKYMVFTIKNILVFIDSIYEFMNSSLDALIKDLSDNDFKYLP